MLSSLRRTLSLTTLGITILAVPMRAQTPQGAPGERLATAADSNGVRDAAMDYIQGWYEGNPDRMQRALHPASAGGWAVG